MPDHKLPNADTGEEATLFPKTAGERLREARESQGLSLAEIAERTRVPIRHLEGIEVSNFSTLPSPTYAVGFAKAYARVVGLDEAMIGREIRGHRDVVHPTPQYQPYESSDPKRSPPRGLAIGGAIVALIAIVGLALFYGTSWFQGGDGKPILAADQSVEPVPAPTGDADAAPAATATSAATSTGQVTLAATDVVWLRVYTADKTLYEAEMKPGERYDVPGDAIKPMINIGRPDKLTVTVNGSAVAPLGSGERAIKDVEISAAALLARGTPAASPTPDADTSSSTGTTRQTTRTAPSRQRASASERRPDSDAEETRRANAAAAETPAPSATPAP